MEPINLTGGAIVSQVSILGIMFVGAFAIRRGDTEARLSEKPSYASLAWLILCVGLLTLAALVASDPFTGTWGPLVGVVSNLGLAGSAALQFTFIIDILCVTAVVYQTGGSRSSPFQSLYFLLPTLAILLREPTGRLITYLALVTVSFTVGMAQGFEEKAEDGPRHRFAYWLVSVSCFVLAVIIGYMTRPS